MEKELRETNNQKVEELCIEVRELIMHECEKKLDDDDLYFFDVDSAELAKVIVYAVIGNSVYDSLKQAIQKILKEISFELDDVDSFIAKILKKKKELFNK